MAEPTGETGGGKNTTSQEALTSDALNIAAALGKRTPAEIQKIAGNNTNPENNTGAHKTTETTEPILTEEAKDILTKLDNGGATPAFVSRNMERILKENGISDEDIRTKTPDELVAILRGRPGTEKPTDQKVLVLLR